MRDCYFSINECTENELEQLREELFYNIEDNEDILSDKEVDFINNLSYADEIPFWLLEKVYGHISFVDEDFWCNINNDKNEYEDLRLEQQGGII